MRSTRPWARSWRADPTAGRQVRRYARAGASVRVVLVLPMLDGPYYGPLAPRGTLRRGQAKLTAIDTAAGPAEERSARNENRKTSSVDPLAAISVVRLGSQHAGDTASRGNSVTPSAKIIRSRRFVKQILAQTLTFPLAACYYK